MDRTQTLRSLRDFLRDEAGATAIGYSLIASSILGAIVAGNGHVAERCTKRFDDRHGTPPGYRLPPSGFSEASSGRALWTTSLRASLRPM